MKRRFARAFISVAAVSAVPATSASASWYEPFDYEANASATALSLGDGTNQNAGSMDAFPGGGTGGSTWTATAAPAATNDADVVSGSLSYSGFPWPTAGNKVGVQSTAQKFNRVMVDQEYGVGSGGPTVFYSMLIRVSDMTGMTNTATGGGFFTGLQYYPLATSASDNMSASAATSAGPITLRQAVSGDPAAGYELGIAFRDAPNSNRIYGDTDFTTADTLFAVVKMEFGTIATGSEDDKATLWIFRDNGNTADPIPLTEPSPLTAHAQSSNVDDDVTLDYFSTANALSTNIRSIIVRGGNTSTPDGLELDEIRVGNAWDQVVPEPTGLALLCVGALGMLRRRRK
jgi:hypothetical protein